MLEDRWAPCPHKSSRRGQPIRLVVLHADASPREASTISWLAHPDSQVSYHVLIHRDGTATRFVGDGDTAWHSGRSAWNGVVGVNRISLGLALANRQDGHEALTDAQRETARRWLAYWQQLYPTIEAVVTHTMVSPGRKSDPERAPNFDLCDFSPLS
jgi:N-acetylmuramoyl-L-alanine amidase